MRRLLPCLLVPLLWFALPKAQASGVITNCAEADLAAAAASGGLVTFSQTCSITLSQPIKITGDVTIDAGTNSVTLSGGNAANLFFVEGNLTLIGLDLVNGHGVAGGAVYIGSGGSLLASGCTFSGNTAAGTNGVAGVNGADNSNGQGGSGTAGGTGVSAVGGAICNAGTLTLLNCTLDTNTVTAGTGGAGGSGGNGGGTFSQGGNGGDGGAGGAALGGAVYNTGNFTAYNCTFANNNLTGGAGGAGGANGSGSFPSQAGNGGAGGLASGAAVYNGKYMTLSGCTFSGNTGKGGNSAAGGTRSNGNGNSGSNGADALGAGLSSTVWGVATNCTFYADVATGGTGGNGGSGTSGFAQAGDGGNGGNGLGGAIYNSGTFTMVNCTIANSAAHGGTNGVAGSGGFIGHLGDPGQPLGGGVANRGVFILLNSLLSTNSPGGNLNGMFTDAGNNLSSDSSFALGASSFTGTDPKLGPLADNGGPTLTMALLAGSPAIDAVGNTPGTFPPTDQRGVARPQGAGADIGAYEFTTGTVPGGPVITSAPPASLSVTQGQTVTLTVGATGNSLAYQWFFQSAPLTGATTRSFTLASAQLTNSGTYTIRVTNSVGTASSSTSLRVVAPTTIASMSVTTNWVSVVFPTKTNLSYVLQYKNKLTDPTWTGLMNTLGTGALVTNEDFLTNPPSRFYRIQVK